MTMQRRFLLIIHLSFVCLFLLLLFFPQLTSRWHGRQTVVARTETKRKKKSSHNPKLLYLFCHMPVWTFAEMSFNFVWWRPFFTDFLFLIPENVQGLLVFCLLVSLDEKLHCHCLVSSFSVSSSNMMHFLMLFFHFFWWFVILFALI